VNRAVSAHRQAEQKLNQVKAVQNGGLAVLNGAKLS
jgi:hypothetical protein